MLKHLLFLLLLSFVLTAHAGRVMPQNVQVGQIGGHAYPEVRIGSEVYRLAPGALIYDAFNRTIVPTSLPQSGRVFYQLDSSGFLSKMWLPTPDEEAEMNP